MVLADGGFQPELFVPSVVNGVMVAGLYGLIAVAMVLSYRISRTVAFVHGGILLGGTLLYWYFTAPADNGVALFGQEAATGRGPDLGTWGAMIVVVLLGVAIATAYGAAVTSNRLANYPRVTLTTFSLAVMLIIVGVMFSLMSAQGERTDSPFGTGTVSIFGDIVTVHQLVSLVTLAVLVTVFSLVLKRTRFGVYMRAIADDVDASRLVGVPIGVVGISVYAMSGGVSAFAGVMLASSIGTDSLSVLFIFLNALIVCVIGAFGSLPLALVGAAVLAILDNSMSAGVFGNIGGGPRELIIIVAIFLVVLLIDRYGKKGKQVIDSEGM